MFTQRRVVIWFAFALVAAVLASAGRAVLADAPAAPGDWPMYGRDAFGTRHSPLARITPANVARLQVAWTYHTGEAADSIVTRSKAQLEATPLVVDGTMYLSTPLGRVTALDPATGRARWTFDPRIDRDADYGDFTNRGVATWVDPAAAAGTPCKRRIYIATIDTRLIALDAARGTPCAGFGDAGTVQLRTGLRNPPSYAGEYEETSPPTIVGGVIVVGSAVADNSRTEAASGEVRGFDARTGALRWTWDPIPQSPSDPAYATWRGPTAHRTGAANAWTVFAADSARGLVYVPTGSASPDYWGGARLGDNRYANSVVALRVATGTLAWHFQTVHHDLWDYDNASPPALTTIRRNGRSVDVVLQGTKTGMLFVLDRDTGTPVFPVEERAVPATDVPGEVASPTQPFTTAIAPLSPHRFDANDAWGATAADRDECRTHIAALRNDGIFTPPSERGSLIVPSNIGGAHWGGMTVDPARHLAVVPVNRVIASITLVPRERAAELKRSGHIAAENRLGVQYTDMRGTPYVLRREIMRSSRGVPCSPPPFGELVAIDLDAGREAWRVPLGDLGGFFAARVPGATAAPAGAPPTGSPSLGGPMSTASGLTFMAGTIDRKLRAFETATGRELWSASLPAGAKATPMTYEIGGRQYVVIAAGGDSDVFGRSDAIVAFALPER